MRYKNMPIEEFNKILPESCRWKATRYCDYILIGNRRKQSVWAECSCGKSAKQIKLEDLVSGHTKSCGCLHSENLAKRNLDNRIYPKSHKDIMVLYNQMMSRCYNKNHASYRFYGERGVRVCDEWIGNHSVFYKWCLENGWQKGLHLDKDILGDGKLYSPDTCKFVTPKENSDAKKSVKKYDYQGSKLPLSDICNIYGVSYYTIWSRMKRCNMTLDEALKKPVKKRLCK